MESKSHGKDNLNKMWTFIKPVDKRFPSIEYPWMVKMDSLDNVFDFFDKRSGTSAGEIMSLVDCWNGESHVTHRLSHFGCETGKNIVADHVGNKAKITDICNYFDSLDVLPKIKHIMMGKTLLVNSHGGFFIVNDNYDLSNTVEKEKLIFPDDREVRIIQWANGSHYYAKIGNIDVVDKYGNQKWDSKELAELAAEEYLRERDQKASL